MRAQIISNTINYATLIETRISRLKGALEVKVHLEKKEKKESRKKKKKKKTTTKRRGEVPRSIDEGEKQEKRKRRRRKRKKRKVKKMHERYNRHNRVFNSSLVFLQGLRR